MKIYFFLFSILIEVFLLGLLHFKKSYKKNSEAGRYEKEHTISVSEAPSSSTSVTGAHIILLLIGAV